MNTNRVNGVRFYNGFHKKTNTQKSVISKKSFTYQFVIEIINKFVDFSSNPSILDYGGGSGTLSFYLADNSCQVTYYDISTKSLDIARKSYARMGREMKINFWNKMNYEEKKFDYILCIEVIEHIEKDEQLLNNFYKLLKKDGKLILSTPSTNAPLYKMGKLEKFDKEVGHVRRYTPVLLSSKVKNAGFKIENVKFRESILRNLLFTNDKFGKLIKFFKWPVSSIINLIDTLLIPFFGESDIFVVAKK